MREYSQCCNAEKTVSHGEDGTSHYICSICGKEFIAKEDEMKYEIISERVNDWAETMIALKIIEVGNDIWHDSDEIVASIMSFIEGNHLKKCK